MTISNIDTKTAIITTAALSSFTTLAITSAFTYYQRQKSLNQLKNEAASSHISNNPTPKPIQYSQELIDEQLARNQAFLGDEAMQKLRDSLVVVVGAGGVGSWAATMLVRSGVGKVRIIDFDQVTLSSLNRHACATVEDVGIPKVECCARFLKKAAPFVEIEPIVSLWSLDKAKELLSGNPTYVIDCIDNIDTKVDLLDYCYSKLKVPVISAMGAGCKADPTRVRIADLSMSNEDPLSRSVRRRLRLRGIEKDIPVVFSAEKPGKGKAKLLQLDDEEFEKGKVDELSVLKDFRVRILPVLGPMPAIFGLTIAAHLLNEIGGYNPVFDPIQGGYSMAGKARTKMYESAVQSLVGQAARLGWEETRKVPIDSSDAGYIIEEVFRGKSPINGESNRLVLTTWEPSKGMLLGNIIPVTREQQSFHEKNVLKGENDDSLEKHYSTGVLDVIKKRLEEDEWYSKFR